MRKFLLIVIAIAVSAFTFANKNAVYTQTVRGTIIDQDSKTPLIGVNVILLGSNPIIGASTDINGNFRLENVTIGRISLKLSSLGYEEKIIPNITVESGKESLLFLEMIESLEHIEEIIVNGGRKRGEVLNEMALLSARTFSVDETKRYAGSLDDPSRMVSAFAGVSNDPEGLNEIVVRGNTPKGIQWRLEDVEIPNPNHFAFESTTGGPINALSSNMLATSDFYTGAFAPEFGNVTSGIFDMKMRNGNNEKHEFTLGLGALGVDVAAEGPFKKGYAGSYLINYRYSTLALIDNLNLVDYGGVPKYQDLTFKVNLPTKKAGKFSMFALLGKSGIDLVEEDENEKVIEDGSQYGRFGIVGLSHLYQINKKSFIKTTIAASNNGTDVKFKTIINDDKLVETNKAHWDKNTLTTSVKYSNKFNAKHRLVIGADYKHFFYDMKDENYYDKKEKWLTFIDLAENAGLFQSYASWKYRITNDITMVSGLHYTNFLLNNSQAIEPRAAINWNLSKRSKLSAGFGKHSMAESIITYYANVHDDEWNNETTPNTDLDLSKANHYVMGYEQRFMKNLNAKIELYYQSLYDVPVENDSTSNYSILNSQHGQVTTELVNGGKGRNYGVEFTLERYFENSYYFLATASIYKSEYKTLKNEWRNTRFDGNYALNFLAGKEFTIGDPEKGRILSLNTRITYNGSRKYIPLDMEASREAGYGIYDHNNAYTHRLDNIMNVNFTASMKFNRPNATHEIILDFMNLLNGQGKVSEYYDSQTEEKIFGTQMSIFPNVMYRIHF